MGKTLRIRNNSTARLILALCVSLTIVGCKDDSNRTAAVPTPGDTGSGATGGTPTTPTTPTTPAPTTNLAPKISGTPITTAKISMPYDFQPRATDPNGDKLTFEVRGKPDWASFDSSTGRLAGTPPPGSTGNYTGVQIIVSDGVNVAQLAPFSIDVREAAVGAAELAWQPPTSNEDGTPLSNLAGYVIHYGRSPGAMDQSVRISNPGVTMYVVENLSEGTWYFSLSAVNGANAESRSTSYVSKTIG